MGHHHTNARNRTRPMFRMLSVLGMVTLGVATAVLGGCMRADEELEPRPDTRPMVSEIDQAEQDWVWISGTQWIVDTLEGTPPIPGSQLRLNFKEHTWLEGHAGCNRYTASYIRKADAGLKIDEILSTRMYCANPAGIMQQESRFFNLLKQVDAYHAEPDRLDLIADGAVILTFVPRTNSLSPITP